MLTDAILRLPAVKAAVGLSKTTIYQRIKDQTFPEPIPIDGGRVGWPESVINAWIAAKKAGIAWQAPINAPSPASPEVAASPAPVVDRAEIVKNRVKKPRKAKPVPEFRLTADPAATPEKRAPKPATRREPSSRNDAAHASLQGEFRFD